MKIHACLVALLSMMPGSFVHAEPDETIRAHYVVTVADDFVVEIYHNGRAVPHAQRHVLNERFGAMTEKIDLEVHAGDWLVFNVVNNRMRWDGVRYFAVAGCLKDDKFGFVSDLKTGNWSACDTFGDADKFITSKGYFQHRPAKEIDHVWGDGDGLMKQYAGGSWSGAPLWGGAQNTWVKVIVQ